jgi:hypothetical protein
MLLARADEGDRMSATTPLFAVAETATLGTRCGADRQLHHPPFRQLARQAALSRQPRGERFEDGGRP